MRFQLLDGNEEYEVEADGPLSAFELTIVHESQVGAVLVRDNVAVAIKRSDRWHMFKPGPVTRSGVYSFGQLPRKAAK
jgi:hypothetical protein